MPLVRYILCCAKQIHIDCVVCPSICRKQGDVLDHPQWKKWFKTTANECLDEIDAKAEAEAEGDEDDKSFESSGNGDYDRGRGKSKQKSSPKQKQKPEHDDSGPDASDPK